MVAAPLSVSRRPSLALSALAARLRCSRPARFSARRSGRRFLSAHSQALSSAKIQGSSNSAESPIVRGHENSSLIFQSSAAVS